MHNVLGIVFLLIERQCDPIGDYVINEIGTHRSEIAEVTHLNRRRPPGEDVGPSVLGKAVQIDEDIDFELTDEIGDVLTALGTYVDEAVEGASDASAKF